MNYKSAILLLVFALFVVTTGCSKKVVKPRPTDITDTVKMETDAGVIKIGLYGNAMPQTVKNFLQYVDSGFYSGTVFHRVIPGFVAQGGGYTKDHKLKQTRPPVVLEMPPAKQVKGEQQQRNDSPEPVLTNKKGTIAMARKMVPNSATSQFYFNLKDNHHLDADLTKHQPNGYAVFGKIISGEEVLNRIVSMTAKQKKSVVIRSVTRVQPTKKEKK